MDEKEKPQQPLHEVPLAICWALTTFFFSFFRKSFVCFESSATLMIIATEDCIRFRSKRPILWKRSRKNITFNFQPKRKRKNIWTGGTQILLQKCFREKIHNNNNQLSESEICPISVLFTKKTIVRKKIIFVVTAAS